MPCTAAVIADASGTILSTRLTVGPTPALNAATPPAGRRRAPAVGSAGDCTGLAAAGAAGDATASPLDLPLTRRASNGGQL